MGPGRLTDGGNTLPVSVAVGDTVLLPEYGGQTLQLGDEELSLFRDDDILGKFHVRCKTQQYSIVSTCNIPGIVVVSAACRPCRPESDEQ